jgi:hypothetical protein
VIAVTAGAIAVVIPPSDSSADSYLPTLRAAKSVKYLRATGNSTLGQARVFERFPLYSLGESFEGKPLVAVNRNLGPEVPEESVRRDDIDFIYGTCKSVNGSGCVPPIEVQVWNACERYKGVYDPAPDGFGPEATLVVRGVEAALFDEGSRLELYTEAATVVIFGSGRGDVMRAAAALRGVNVGLPPAAALPKPRAGTNDGALPCQT